jgi:hypothetical protein
MHVAIKAKATKPDRLSVSYQAGQLAFSRGWPCLFLLRAHLVR